MEVQVPVVSTASKFAQKATEAPADATVITSDEIKKYGWRTLGDLLASVRIMLPETSDPELEALMKKWRSEKPYDPRKGM